MYDAIIVGARCRAGSVWQRVAARRGYRSLACRPRYVSSDMPMSSHFVHQRGIACLARWGLRDQVVATHSPPVSRFATRCRPLSPSPATAPPRR